MKLDIYQVDAFTNEIFRGNPAAVCPLDEWPPHNIMQQIAKENNLSETAFFVPEEHNINLRWFTPTTEVDLCGHATLGTAHILFTRLEYGKSIITFSTRSGELKVNQEKDGWYAMDFPVKSLKRETIPEPLKRGIGDVRVDECYRADDYMLIAEDEEQVRNIDPDFSLLSEVETRGIIITAPGDDVDFVSRFFAPAAGINEDPVTGSAHTMLTPYWAKRLNKRHLDACQISTRGGILKCTLLSEDRVEISGQACTYMMGEIELSGM